MCIEDTLIIKNKKVYKSRQEIFNTAGQLAVEQLKAMNLPVTFVRNGNIIKKYSDGREELIGTAPQRVTVKERIFHLK